VSKFNTADAKRIILETPLFSGNENEQTEELNITFHIPEYLNSYLAVRSAATGITGRRLCDLLGETFCTLYTDVTKNIVHISNKIRRLLFIIIIKCF